MRDNATVLAALFRHHTWANLKLLEFCASLGDDQLRATADGAYGSVRGTLAHLTGAEVDYVHRVTGELLASWLDADQFPGFAALEDAARKTGKALEQIAAAAQPGDMVREDLPEEHVVVQYPLAGLLLQAINHAADHRQQVCAILTQLGLQPPELDGWAWLTETGQFEEQHTA